MNYGVSYTEIAGNTHDSDLNNYSFKITDYLDSYDDWLQIIYDRSPALPEAIKKDSGIFEDLQLNVKKRFETPFFKKRSFPRVPIDEEVTWIYNKRRR